MWPRCALRNHGTRVIQHICECVSFRSVQNHRIRPLLSSASRGGGACLVLATSSRCRGSSPRRNTLAWSCRPLHRRPLTISLSYRGRSSTILPPCPLSPLPSSLALARCSWVEMALEVRRPHMRCLLCTRIYSSAPKLQSPTLHRLRRVDIARRFSRQAALVSRHPGRR